MTKMNKDRQYYYIYQITNNLNGKIYVGVHRTLNLDDNYWGSGKCLLRAFKKYGKENFKKTILQFFDSLEEMFETEAEIVNKSFVARDDTYNLELGGHGGGIIPSVETRAKRSLSMKGRKQSAEHVRKRTEVRKGKKCSEEARKRMSEAHKGISLSDEHKKRISEAQRGHLVSDKTRSKVSESRKGKKVSDETKKKLSEINMGSVVSKETKLKISKALKGKYTGENSSAYGRHHTKEWKQKMSELHKHNGNIPPSNLGKKHSEETKKKMSDARTNYWNRIKNTKLLYALQPNSAL